MPSPLEKLPTELLDHILVWLPIEAAVNLWKSNKSMSHRLDNHLFRQTAVFNRTKQWACKRGDVEVLRAAIARDGDPNLVLGTEPRRMILSESRPNNWSRFQIGPASTLRIVIECNRAEALDALLELGATFQVMGDEDRMMLSNHLVRYISEKPPKMLEALTRANLGPWVLKRKGYGRYFSDFVSAGAPVGILRSIVQNPNEITGHKRSWGWTPLSSAISVGKSDIVNMLVEKGADINGVVEEQSPKTTFRVGYYKSDERSRIKYRQPSHVPIFAAAVYMARFRSTAMLDLCLHHGADINQKSPAVIRQEGKMKDYNITPLMAYLQAINVLPVKGDLDPVAGIKHFIDRGADIILNESPRKRYFGSTMWLNVSMEDYSLPLSIVEILLYKWGLSKLQESQFLNTITYLITQGSGLDRAEDIIFHFSFRSSVISRPLLYQHGDHPNNVPEWLKIVEVLWDKLDKVHGHSYAWIQHSLQSQRETETLICAGIKTQEQKDRLLYTYFNDHCLLLPHLHDTLSRLALDRQIALGANINAPVGESGETLLFHVCNQINNALVTGKSEAIDTDYKAPEMVDLFHTRLGELVTSLVSKGADPMMPINDWTSLYDDWTPYHVLKRDIDKATLKNREFLVSLVSDMEKVRAEFLENGTMDNVLIKRADVLDISPPRGWS